MSSAAQVTANLANAQHSSGPRTETGKAASSQNALKHGLTAKTILLPGEDEAAYRKMCEGMIESFEPTYEPEKELLQLLCDTQWRLQRCGRIEAAILSADILDFKALDIMSKHEARLKRQYSTTLKEARDMIDARVTREEAEIREAMTIRRADKIDGCTTNLQAIGFVFSDDHVDAAIHAGDTLALAQKVVANHRYSKMATYGMASDTQKQGQ
jgi:hypothetical protein